jgi:AcrR family transcriptional regulator
MTDKAAPKSRPGGRTARTTATVFQAVAALIAEKGHAAVSMADVAERAGVAATSLYRRWGDVRALIMEVAVEHLIRDHPLPDTGSLARDLLEWARSIAAGLRRPDGSSFFRALVATIMPAETGSAARIAALEKRREQIAIMLDRANARGERPPPIADVLDHMLAPLYMRALFGVPADEAFAERLVERLLKSPASRRA